MRAKKAVEDTETGEDTEAVGVKALAENKGSGAPSTNLNSLLSSDFARALARANALKTATTNP